MGTPQTEIIITNDDNAELVRRTVPPGEYVIGRSAECDVTVPTELVSRKHAKLTLQPHGTMIEDLGSSNGTFVGGRQITEGTRVFPNQKVLLGSVKVELRRLGTEAAPQTMSPHSEAVRKHLPPAFLRERKYEVGSVIAQGGMGAILEGQDNALRRKVAMKRMLHAEDQEQLVRFIEEAQITAQLDHPNIVPVYELGVDEEEQVFYTMKLVRGITLHTVLGMIEQGGPDALKKYPLAALLNILQKVCDGLAFAHSKGVMHRDLKPENIMLGEYGEVLVMDWGLARASDKALSGEEDLQRSMIRSARKDEGMMTMAGMVFGTPQYMAPEQARGDTDAFDARTDIYALGAILYHLLALEPPVSGDDMGAVLQSVASGKVAEHVAVRGMKEAPPRLRPHLPDGRIPVTLAAITRKAMALKQADRYATVREFQEAVEAFQSGLAAGAPDRAAPASPRKVRILFAIIAGLGLLVVVLAVLLALKNGVQA